MLEPKTKVAHMAGWKGEVLKFEETLSEKAGRNIYTCRREDGLLLVSSETSLTILALPEETKQSEAKRLARAQSRVERVFARPTTSTLLSYLHSVREAVILRFSWTESLHNRVQSRFEQLGILLPENARGIRSGERGGRPMYSLSAELKFPCPDNKTILPENCRVIDGVAYISDIGLNLYLAQQGFAINSYAKI